MTTTNLANSRDMISAVIICRNEEDNIGTCISAVLPWVDEVVVVDSGSTDATLDVIQSFGIRPVHHEFEGFGRQKQFACSLATHPWILSLDADEVVSPELGQHIRTTLMGSTNTAFRLTRRFRFLGRTFMHGHGAVDYPIRLFKKDLCSFDDSLVHESVQVTGSIGRIEGELLHTSYTSLDQYLTKFNSYTSLGAQKLVTQGTYRGPIGAALLLPLYFLKHYVVWGNVLNGRQGLIWSILSTLYPFVKVCKAWAARKT